MYILAFETSCDDTSIALFEDAILRSMHTKSQVKIHEKTGGVVPEVAAREHANSIFEVLDAVLKEGGVSLEDIDYIGVTTQPGLIPSLLTGITVANTIATSLKIPIIPIHHIEAHIFANYLEREEQEIKFPLVCLTVSGGHNEIYAMKSMWELEKIGGTIDDAAGEAFDKVAKMMGLGYPGGPIISKKALMYRQLSLHSLVRSKTESGLFPRVWLDKKAFDFSFSGLKTAVKREIDARIETSGSLREEDIQEISYEFEESVTEVLAYKLIEAAKMKQVSTVMLAGGVSANTILRDKIQLLADTHELEFLYPKKIQYCMDNAAMVGINTYYKVRYEKYERDIYQVTV